MHPKDAHANLEPFCKDNAGIGISIDVIRRVLLRQISQSSSAVQDMPSSELFKSKYRVTFDAEVDMSAITLAFIDIQEPQGADRPGLTLGNLFISFTLKVDAKAVAKVRLNYSEVIGLFGFLDRRIVITPQSETHATDRVEHLWETDDALKTQLESNPYEFSDADWDDLKLLVRAAILNAAPAMARSVVEALEFPDFLEMFVGITFGNDSRFAAKDNLLMFTATTSLNFGNCPSHKPAFSGAVQTWTTFDGAVVEPLSASNVEALEALPEALNVSGQISEGHPDYQWPVPLPNEEPSNVGHVFLFTPVNLLRANFDGVLKPAVNTNDRSRNGPFFTHYSLTAALDGQLDLNLVKPWPIVFRLTTGVFAAGQAGAGIKIGSIWHEAIGVQFDGRVHLDVKFSISYDHRRRDIVFVSRVEHAKAHDFHFTNSLPWPISSVAGWILEQVVKKLLPILSRQVVKTTRIPIAELGLLADVADLLPGMVGQSDPATGNATFGVALDL
ncbi:hypothetical protein PVT71_13710 [Salipiger sp. H15]|uniref:Lipid-binding serum glycoprotein C-terminal domain-containing protein n=1 Tax=Alloyangia sp. H15 TaxID=3029062 RepID=A0AAU8AFA8_9RHOB